MIEKDENLRAIKKSRGEQFRVLQDKTSFAWYICIPKQVELKYRAKSRRILSALKVICRWRERIT